MLTPRKSGRPSPVRNHAETTAYWLFPIVSAWVLAGQASLYGYAAPVAPEVGGADVALPVTASVTLLAMALNILALGRLSAVPTTLALALAPQVAALVEPRLPAGLTGFLMSSIIPLVIILLPLLMQRWRKLDAIAVAATAGATLTVFLLYTGLIVLPVVSRTPDGEWVGIARDGTAFMALFAMAIWAWGALFVARIHHTRAATISVPAAISRIDLDALD